MLSMFLIRKVTNFMLNFCFHSLQEKSKSKLRGKNLLENYLLISNLTRIKGHIKFFARHFNYLATAIVSSASAFPSCL